MNWELIKNESRTSDRLIIFFNGWAMTPESVDFIIKPKNTDLLILSDYRQLRIEGEKPNIQSYESIDWVAWSMGVWASEQVFKRQLISNLFDGSDGLEERIDQKVAVCGSSFPIHDRYGIPTAIFQATKNNLNEENRQRFNRRMCGGKSLKRLFDALTQRSTDELIEELDAPLSSIPKNRKEETESILFAENFWTKTHIGLKDLIIPPDNLLRWASSANIFHIEHPIAQHYLFKEIQSWEEIL